MHEEVLMLKKHFLTNLHCFDLHIAGGYTVSLVCSQFLVVFALPDIDMSIVLLFLIEENNNFRYKAICSIQED